MLAHCTPWEAYIFICAHALGYQPLYAVCAAIDIFFAVISTNKFLEACPFVHDYAFSMHSTTVTDLPSQMKSASILCSRLLVIVRSLHAESDLVQGLVWILCHASACGFTIYGGGHIVVVL